MEKIVKGCLYTIPCTLQFAGFSHDLGFTIPCEGDTKVSGICNHQYLWNTDGTVQGPKIHQGESILGRVTVRVLTVDENFAFVDLPAGNKPLKVPHSILQTFPLSMMPTG